MFAIIPYEITKSIHLQEDLKFFRSVFSRIWTKYREPVFGDLLVLIFSHSDLIRKGTEYLSILSPNAGKYGP